jgi:UDP-N-acetyl-D-glucosamine dehydrogenase
MSVTAEQTVVIGQGYVGLPVAVRAVLGGYDVIGFEVDTAKVDALNAGVSHVEDIRGEQMREILDTGRYRATADPEDLAGFEIAVISVPTPMGEGVPDLSFIESAAHTLGPHVSSGSTVILESTTYPGTTEELVGPILEERSGLRVGTDFHLGYSLRTSRGRSSARSAGRSVSSSSPTTSTSTCPTMSCEGSKRCSTTTARR